MSAIRVLHVDDEPDIREVVDISLGLNPDFEVQACSSGMEAVATAAEWSPSVILLDAMMPGIDGPETLAQLRRNPQTADIPVLFMTARAQTREVEHFITLGALGVISKPFDPMTLAALVRSHLQGVRMGTLRGIFVRRAGADALLLKPYRSQPADSCDAATLGRVRQIAHGLAGAAGLYGFDEISAAASALERAATANGAGAQADLPHAIERLVAKVETLRNEWTKPAAAVA